MDQSMGFKTIIGWWSFYTWLKEDLFLRGWKFNQNICLISVHFTRHFVFWLPSHLDCFRSFDLRPLRTLVFRSWDYLVNALVRGLLANPRLPCLVEEIYNDEELKWKFVITYKYISQLRNTYLVTPHLRYSVVSSEFICAWGVFFMSTTISCCKDIISRSRKLSTVQFHCRKRRVICKISFTALHGRFGRQSLFVHSTVWTKWYYSWTLLSAIQWTFRKCQTAV